ncbi:MAG: antibiotic biosynthesis monooxygenase [Nocardiopsaceae bacterium]|jgi:quinol monooxygenase YgiN|nr:antibiotic biosynthesis monooxygenase [Nocardiopsaceae bacterium]
MTASLIVVALGTVIAAVGTGVLAARCARTPKMFLAAWTIAVFGLAVSLAAQALGDLSGYSDLIFRAMELGGQGIAPLALSLGLVELVAWGLPARFSMRLAVSAIGVIVLVVLGTDPLSGASKLTTSWPDPSVFYNIIPLGLTEFLAAFTAGTAVISALVALARSSRGPAYAEVTAPALTASAAAIAISVPGLMMLAQVKFGGSVFALVALVAAALTWLAASSAVRRGLADDRGPGDRDRRRQPAGPGWYDDDDYLTSAYRDEAARRSAAGTGQRYGDDHGGVGYPALAALAAERSEPAHRDPGRYDSSQFDSAQFDSAQFDSGLLPDSGVIEPYERRAERHAADPAQAGQMFGQITIYTLLDDRLRDFDRMTEEVVEQVRSLEPGTLVYIVHGVPTAPMQRILYEVYRDRAAYDEHMARPYVARYVAERRSMVLATNAIELGLQQAKVSPLPSYSAISDILSESGIDLTGVTKSSRAKAAQHGQAGHPDGGYREASHREQGGHREQASHPDQAGRHVPGGHPGYSGEDRQAGQHARSDPREQPGHRSGGYDSHGDPLGLDDEDWPETRDQDQWYR